MSTKKKNKGSNKSQGRAGLAEELLTEQNIELEQAKKQQGKKRRGNDEAQAPSKRFQNEDYMGNDDEDDEILSKTTNVVEKGLSKKILKKAKEQLAEEDNRQKSKMKAAFTDFNKRGSDDEEEDDKFSDAEEDDYNLDEELQQITEEDERALEMFMGPTTARAQGATINLADLIMDKIKQKEAIDRGELDSKLASSIDPKVVQVYQGVGAMLSKYTSGKLPKAFKVIPTLKNWEEIVYLTNPDGWSPCAVRAATRLFASNLNNKMAQRFYNLILLPRVREDIRAYKKLNFHLYFSLRKALFKPAAFYKGFLLPLCESRDCTLREATIVGSVLAKTSIPVLHSSAAILKIAEMEYSGANSLFLRILLNKKYALPYRVVDALVNHFMKFIHDERKLPMLWYDALLVLVQRYKTDLLPEQKDQLKSLLRKHSHPLYVDEIRRELVNSKSRGEIENAANQNGNTVMVM